jgi:hypothetical protein
MIEWRQLNGAGAAAMTAAASGRQILPARKFMIVDTVVLRRESKEKPAVFRAFRDGTGLADHRRASLSEPSAMNVLSVAATSASRADAARTSPGRSSDFAGALALAQSARNGGPPPVIHSPLMAARLVLPTREAVEELAAGVADKLAGRLKSAGIAANPPISFSVDGDGAIHASGERSDLSAVEAAVADDADLVRDIRNTTAVASHAYALENGGHLQVQRAYRLSANSQEVVAQYANLSTGSRGASMSVRFSEVGIAVDADGKGWIGAA